MSFFNGVSESISQLAYAISKNGFGESMMFNAAGVSKSAAYNKMSAAARGIINNMSMDDAKKVREAIGKGIEFDTDAFNTTLQNMMTGDDEAAKKIAQEFNTLRGGYDKARSIADADASKAVSAYAEFLGRDSGKLNAFDAINGYFGDKQLGGTRIKGAIGAAAGVGVATRLLSGGSLTRTNTGERDIAGVPFL